MTSEERPTVSLRELLNGRNVPCPSCDYNLRDLTGDRCPECGVALSIEGLLRPTSIFDWSWAVALMSASIGIVESYLKWHELRITGRLEYGWFEDEGSPWEIWTSHAYWLGLIPLALALLICRRWFGRLPRGLRWSVAVSLALACLLFHRRLAHW